MVIRNCLFKKSIEPFSILTSSISFWYFIWLFNDAVPMFDKLNSLLHNLHLALVVSFHFFYPLLKACVHYFSLFLKEQCVSWLFWTKYFEKKFNLQLFYLPTVSWTFIPFWATMRYLPPWNFLFWKNKCMCNRDIPCDVATCPDK